MNSKKDRFSRYSKLFFLIIFLVALTVRLMLAVTCKEMPSSDARGYDERAMSIVNGQGFSEGGKPTSLVEPFYSFFLAAIYYIFGHNYMMVRIIQAILGTFVCVIIFLISKEIFDAKVGLISMAIASLNPGFIKSTKHLFTENLYTFLLILAIYFLLKQVKEKGYKNLILLGLTLGVASLTRPVIFYFPLFILLFMSKHLVCQDCSNKRYILTIIVFIFFFILPISPWTLRNWRLHHRFIPVSTNLGKNLYCSYFPKDGKLYGFVTTYQMSEKMKGIDSEVEQSNFLVKETLKFIKNNPIHVLKLEILKIAYFWSPFDWEIIGNGVYNFMYVFILPFFIYGIFSTFKRFNELLPIYLPIIYSFLIALITYGSPRFRLPIEPYLIVLASAGISYFINRFSRKVYPVLLTGGYFFLNLFFYFISPSVKIFVREIFEKIGLW